MKRPAVKGKVFLALQLSLLFSSLSGVASNGCKTAISFSAILLLLWVGSSDYGGLCLCLAADSALSATYLCLRK